MLYDFEMPTKQKGYALSELVTIITGCLVFTFTLYILEVSTL